eukprot:442684-Prorocentrum_minimum.AAC.1
MLNIAVVGNRCIVWTLFTVHLDFRSVVSVEALGRLHLTKLPPTTSLSSGSDLDTSWVLDPARYSTQSLAPGISGYHRRR